MVPRDYYCYNKAIYDNFKQVKTKAQQAGGYASPVSCAFCFHIPKGGDKLRILTFRLPS